MGGAVQAYLVVTDNEHRKLTEQFRQVIPIVSSKFVEKEIVFGKPAFVFGDDTTGKVESPGRQEMERRGRGYPRVISHKGLHNRHRRRIPLLSGHADLDGRIVDRPGDRRCLRDQPACLVIASDIGDPPSRHKEFAPGWIILFFREHCLETATHIVIRCKRGVAALGGVDPQVRPILDEVSHTETRSCSHYEAYATRNRRDRIGEDPDLVLVGAVEKRYTEADRGEIVDQERLQTRVIRETRFRDPPGHVAEIAHAVSDRTGSAYGDDRWWWE